MIWIWDHDLLSIKNFYFRKSTIRKKRKTPNLRVATGDYFFINLTTSFSVKFYLTLKPKQKKLGLFLYWKSGSKTNKKIVACGNPVYIMRSSYERDKSHLHACAKVHVIWWYYNVITTHLAVLCNTKIKVFRFN